MNWAFKVNICNEAMMRKSTKKNCNKRKWGSGSHLQGIFGSASLSWLEEITRVFQPALTALKFLSGTTCRSNRVGPRSLSSLDERLRFLYSLTEDNHGGRVG